MTAYNKIVTLTPAILQILNLYERFLLPMGPELLPCLSGLLSSILPGLGEEDMDT